MAKNKYTLKQAASIKRMIHDAFLRGFAYGKTNEPNEKELVREADKETERVIKYENEKYKENEQV